MLVDLTDNNPNVFYELGVRHALKHKTILVAQDRSQIPFDLQPYANHIYDWKTKNDRADFARRITELLIEIDENPDRPDNPVSDFLESRISTDEERFISQSTTLVQVHNEPKLEILFGLSPKWDQERALRDIQVVEGTQDNQLDIHMGVINRGDLAVDVARFGLGML